MSVKVRFFKIIRYFTIILMLSLSVGSSINVYARSDVDAIVYLVENSATITKICKDSNNSVGGVTILTYTGRDGLLSFSNTEYNTLSISDKEKFMETSLYLVKESKLGSQIKNKMYNFIAEQDSTTSAAVKFLRSDASTDFVSAAAWFKPFGSVAGVILGVVALFIFMFIGLSILFDICYLALPFVKLFFKEKGKPKVISKEAYTAEIDAEESARGGVYQSSISLYLRRRIPALIVICIAVGYLISGQIYDIVAFFVDSFGYMF